MQNAKSLYDGHRFPAAVVSRAVRWYLRFSGSACLISKNRCSGTEVIVSYKTVRRWYDKSGAYFTRRLAAGAATSHLKEVSVTLHVEPYLLWRAG